MTFRNLNLNKLDDFLDENESVVDVTNILEVFIAIVVSDYPIWMKFEEKFEWLRNNIDKLNEKQQYRVREGFEILDRFMRNTDDSKNQS